MTTEKTLVQVVCYVRSKQIDLNIRINKYHTSSIK